MPMLLRSIREHWHGINHLCWTPAPETLVDSELVDLAGKRRIQLDPCGRHSTICLQKVNALLDRRYT